MDGFKYLRIKEARSIQVSSAALAQHELGHGFDLQDKKTDRQTGVAGKEGEEGAAPQAAAVCWVRRWRLKGNTRKQKDEERQGKTRGVWEVVKRLRCY